MMRRLMLIAVALPLVASAELTLLTYDGSAEHMITGTVDLGDVPAGDSREIRFHVRNYGAAAVSLRTVALSGQGFTISSAPSLPFLIAPLNFTEVRIRLGTATAGNYSATLAANGVHAEVQATVIATATIALAGGSGAPLADGAVLDFGRVASGQVSTLDVRIANNTNASLMISSCSISGSAFRAPALGCPMALSAGAGVTVSITFAPIAAGSQQGRFAIGTRTFLMAGVGYDPPLPQTSITFDSPLTSGNQKKLRIGLTPIAQSAGSGTVTLSFQPSSSGMGDDPAIRFMASGARSLSFQVHSGDQSAAFPSGVDTTFQTGTTAGTIVFVVKLGDFEQKFSFPVAPAAMYVDAATAGRRVQDLDVSITGFDNTGTAGRFSFTFFDTSGRTVAPGAIGTDWSTVFANYFRQSTAGGSFTLRATFPVSGNATLIAGVEVEMTNSAGTVRTARIPF